MVRNLPRSRDFYCNVLGAEVCREYGDHTVVLNCVGRLLQLTTPKNVMPDTPGILFAPRTDATVSHAIVIGVTDCNAAYEVLRKRGAEFLTPPVHTEVGTRCSFRDLDGHLLELRETWLD